MLGYLTLIFACQLMGETLAVLTGLPVPGPVIGMGILLTGLILRGSIPDDLGKVGDALLGHLSLLFVPAGVGVISHWTLLSREWAAAGGALVVSTLLTIAVTAWVMRALGRGARR